MTRSPPRSNKKSPRYSQKCAKLPILQVAILGFKLAILATSWRQVGQLSAIFTPTWPILAPRCAPTGFRIEAQARPNQHPGASWRQGGRQDHPWTSNFPGCGLRFCNKCVNCLPFFEDTFGNALPIFVMILALSVPCQSRSNTPMAEGPANFMLKFESTMLN